MHRGAARRARPRRGRHRALIGNNRGGTNGWIARNAIYGVLLRVDP
ncbi:hypothetical protein DB32_000820 [Sandaracinus amylolyticus]|uniref:Uncharacterized protein n=1 Tax=Sandaracinus amylolyticus TaxID=927083 RepID=A0A0F6VZV9_9BACT|nr:hypothetical protein DB32_000820 [Sandaracinus amylolyticus]